MELYLRDNDPTRTALVTADGEELYKIDSPNYDKGVTTMLKLPWSFENLRGPAALEVGMIVPLHPRGARLLVSAEDSQIYYDMSHKQEVGSDWSFVGPDKRPYRWQTLLQKPVLILDDNSFTPIARYRRAKTGIVSRPRRAFLEIMPAGVHIVDFVVVTFVSYAKHNFVYEAPAEPSG